MDLFPSKQRYIEVDEEEQNLAPKFLFTSADLEVTEGDQVGVRVAAFIAFKFIDWSQSGNPEYR